MQNFSQKKPLSVHRMGNENERTVYRFVHYRAKKIQPPEGDCIRVKEQYNGA